MLLYSGLVLWILRVGGLIERRRPRAESRKKSQFAIHESLDECTSAHSFDEFTVFHLLQCLSHCS
jgi:hypothetical protein